MARPTVHDIAREAGVSLATVDRVLNDRPGVRAVTVERVRGAMARLDYVRDTYAANLARRSALRFAFVWEAGDPFAAAMAGALTAARRAGLADRAEVEVLEVAARDPHGAARAIEALGPRDGVALALPETPQLRDAVGHVRAAGTAVVTLGTDLPSSARDRFVGIDGAAAGRTAAALMGRFARGGDVLVAAATLQSREAALRRLGFADLLAARFPGLRALPTLETWGDPARLVRALERAGPLAGLYSTGPLPDGIGPALAAARPGAVIAHELTRGARAGLRAGWLDAVVAQDPGHLVRSALRVMRAAREGRPVDAAQERIRIEIVMDENLPDAAEREDEDT